MRARPLLLMVVMALTGCAGQVEEAPVRVASLKGPTTMGLAAAILEPQSFLEGEVRFTLEGKPETIATQLVVEDVDIALIPANLAAIIHARSSAVKVACVNTENALYLVTKSVEIKDVADLSGKTIYSTGKGATPQAVMDVIMDHDDLKVDIRYLSEASEVATRLIADEVGIAVLPEPFVSVVQARDPKVQVAINLGAEFERVTGVPVVTGVTVVRQEFLASHPDRVAQFLEGASRSVDFAKDHPVRAAQMITELGITPSAEIAETAIPRSGMVSDCSASAKTRYLGFLKVLFDFNPEIVGGSMPDERIWR